eukprot:Nitzschia sp. Nitz4//scaffold263_size26989//25648//26665//NITZ4_008229-RA/size26989-snap-gene-0.13-mRNA-1//1//CDS//3329544781//8678//frame0
MKLSALSLVSTSSWLLLVLLVQGSCAQEYDYKDYQDYGAQDDLYHNYAERHNARAVDQGRGGLPWGGMVATGAASWFLGARMHAGRVAKKLKSKHQKEQKQLYSQYYNDVYKLSEQNQLLLIQIEELVDMVKSTEAKAELDALQRDYDEFKQPDIDGDDRISRAEFNMYVKNYLSHYPGLSEKDYPKFDDFDHDGDGFVSFHEYSQQMAVVAAQAERDQLMGVGQDQKAQAMKDLYKASYR